MKRIHHCTHVFDNNKSSSIFIYWEIYVINLLWTTLNQYYRLICSGHSHSKSCDRPICTISVGSWKSMGISYKYNFIWGFSVRTKYLTCFYAHYTRGTGDLLYTVGYTKTNKMIPMQDHTTIKWFRVLQLSKLWQFPILILNYNIMEIKVCQHQIR